MGWSAGENFVPRGQRLVGEACCRAGATSLDFAGTSADLRRPWGKTLVVSFRSLGVAVLSTGDELVESRRESGKRCRFEICQFLFRLMAQIPPGRRRTGPLVVAPDDGLA